MSETIRGYVIKKNKRDGKSKKPPYRPYTLWSLGIADAPDADVTVWISTGFNAPAVEEGQYVEVRAEREGDYLNAQSENIRLVDVPERRESRPAPASVRANDSVADSGPVGADRQTQIVLQHSQEMAIAAVTLLLNNKALPVTSAQTKAGEAKRFDEIMAAIDKLTVQYFNDVVTGRLLEVVADLGELRVSTKADGPIPAVVDDGNEGEKFDE